MEPGVLVNDVAGQIVRRWRAEEGRHFRDILLGDVTAQRGDLFDEVEHGVDITNPARREGAQRPGGMPLTRMFAGPRSQAR